MNNIVPMYVDREMSLSMIASETGISKSTIRRMLIASGVQPRSRHEGILVQATSGRWGERHTGMKRPPTSEKTRAKMSKAKREWADKNAKGWRETSSGYVEFTVGEHSGRLAHVVAMEIQIGRRISGEEVVHHIDGDRKNNSIENLKLMTRAEHSRHHALENHALRLRNGRGQFI